MIDIIIITLLFFPCRHQLRNKIYASPRYRIGCFDREPQRLPRDAPSRWSPREQTAHLPNAAKNSVKKHDTKDQYQRENNGFIYAWLLTVYKRITYSTIVILFESTHDRRPPPPRTTNNDHFPNITASNSSRGCLWYDRSARLRLRWPPSKLFVLLLDAACDTKSASLLRTRRALWLTTSRVLTSTRRFILSPSGAGQSEVSPRCAAQQFHANLTCSLKKKSRATVVVQQ